jgi:hypothetical protein
VRWRPTLSGQGQRLKGCGGFYCGVGGPWLGFKWIIESKMALGFTVWRSLI